MKRIIQYVFFTFLISWTFMLLRYLSQEEILPEIFSMFGTLSILGPICSFMIVLKLEKKKVLVELRKLFQGKTPGWVYWFVVFSPFVLSHLAFLIYFFVGNGTSLWGMTVQMLIPNALMILILGGPVEEFGWRGFLLPNLRRKYSFIWSIIIMGIIHGIWHIPLHFIEGTVQYEMPIWQFLVITLLTTVSYAFVYEFTKNLLPMIILHWVSNFSSALFVYWHNEAGRYAIFVFAIILDAFLIIKYYRYRKISIETKTV